MKTQSLFEAHGLNCERFPLGELGTNAYLLYDAEGGPGLVVDPGDRGPAMLARIRSLKLDPLTVFLTHGHIDHIGGIDWLRQETGARVVVSPEDAGALTDPAVNLSLYMGEPLAFKAADATIVHGEEISLGRHRGKVIAVPGHTPGGLALAFPGLVISGDALFAGSIGRSDFPGGNGPLLVRMIRERLLTLGDGVVLPGHGPETTLAAEGRENPFLREGFLL